MIRAIVLSSIAGIIGTGIGGIICCILKNPSKRLMANLFYIASGIMLGISFIQLIPEAIEISNIIICSIGLIIGLALLLILNKAVMKYNKDNNSREHNYIVTGIILFIAISLHDFPEGLAIGGGSNLSIGLSTAISIGIHNIPEGMAVGLPLILAKKKKMTIIGLCCLTGISTILGGIAGYLIGNISNLFMSICLSFAAGAMIAVVFMEMIPEADLFYQNDNKKDTTVSMFLGIVITLFIELLA